MKDGLILEDGELVYYKKGRPEHAGAIKVDGAIYYIASNGRAVKGQHVVHSEMTNGLLKRGTYTFGEDGKLIRGSYIAPKKQKRKLKITKKQRFWVALGVLMLVCTLTVIFAIQNHGVAPPSETGDATDETLPLADRITLPSFPEEVVLCSATAKQLYDGEISIDTASLAVEPYRAFRFDYYLEDATGILRLSESEQLTNARQFVLDPFKDELVIDNLKTGTTYYYTVTVDGEEYPGSFRTAKSTRYISIPGTENTRDIGGYVNRDGKTVKQGLLIRGTEIDGLVVARYLLPASKAEDVQADFGFVYDFDLRNRDIFSGVYQSRLGENVKHKFYGAPQYGQIFNTAYYPALREIFTELAKPENYPMYMHCTWGADRTGTIVYLLQGLLNLSEEDMEREYRLTAFVDDTFIENPAMEAVTDGLRAYEGKTVQEQIVSFLTTDVGITEAQIESIRNIFLEE